MAQITRRAWSALQTEATLALGGHAYTNFSSRVQYWLTEAYYDLCAAYHHYELDKNVIVSVPQGTSQIQLPTDCFIVVGVGLLDSSDQPIRFLRSEHFRVLGGTLRSSQSDLLSCARFQNSLYFNAPAKAGVRIRIYYYRYPIAPDFTAATGVPPGVPETQWLWDTHLIEGAVAKGQKRIWRPDLAQFNAQSLSEWLEEQTQSQTKDEPTGTQPDKAVPNQQIGGKQT